MSAVQDQNPDEVVPEFDPFEKLTNPQLTELYLVERNAYRELIGRAERISRGSGGILSTGNRMYWAAVLFTRLVVTAKSANRLLPDTKPGEHWDFSAAASLVRNLLEATLVYHWLCGSAVADEVRGGRFILFYLHDYGSRGRLFPEQIKDPDPVHDDLVKRFDANPYLATFDARQRRVALKGEKTPFIQDDVLAEMGLNSDDFRFLYRFFSQHTHTGPVAFYRMADHGRGTGVETRHEKMYMVIAIQSAREMLSRAIAEHLTIFPDAETRPPHLTPRQIKINVETEQGRLRTKPGRRWR